MSTLQKEIPSVEKSPEDVFVIHACFTNTQNVGHLSPRVVCIYVQNLNASSSEKFSIAKYASKNDIKIDVIEDWYDDLEIYVLDDFNSFLKSKPGGTFIYWLDEGQDLILDTIKNRFEELNKGNTKKKFHYIPFPNRKSIQFLMKKISDGESPSDLKLFIKKHNQEQLIASYLNTGEESNCFSRKEFDLISSSLVAKVSFFVKLLNDVSKQKAKSDKKSITPIDLTAMGPFEILGNLNVKSWGVLTGLAGIVYSISFFITTNSNKKEIETIKGEYQQLEVKVTKQNEGAQLQKLNYTDTIKDLRKEIVDLKVQLRTKPDSGKLNQNVVSGGDSK